MGLMHLYFRVCRLYSRREADIRYCYILVVFSVDWAKQLIQLITPIIKPVNIIIRWWAIVMLSGFWFWITLREQFIHYSTKL